MPVFEQAYKILRRHNTALVDSKEFEKEFKTLGTAEIGLCLYHLVEHNRIVGLPSPTEACNLTNVHHMDVVIAQTAADALKKELKRAPILWKVRYFSYLLEKKRILFTSAAIANNHDNSNNNDIANPPPAIFDINMHNNADTSTVRFKFSIFHF